MFNHVPERYNCPICIGIQGLENEHTLIRQSDIVFRDELIAVFIGSFFVGNNPGHPIIVPNEHFENLYDLPEQYSRRIMKVSRNIALALKAVRRCEGITVLQNNEPAGGQHAFHFHMHVFPRFTGDELHANIGKSYTSTPEERKPYAEALKQHCAESYFT